MTNYDIYKLVMFVLRKDDKGYPDIINNFSKLLQQASLDHFKEKYNLYQLNQEINDSLSPFEVIEDVSDLTTTTTTITLPTDYAHFIGMYWTDGDGYDRAFDLVTDVEWDMRLGSTVVAPSNSYPICKIVDGKLYVHPIIDSSGTGSLIYYGSGDKALTMSEIELLSSETMTSGTKIYSYNPTMQVPYVAYPSNYGNLTSILDTNSYEVISDWTLRNGTVGGITYNIYEFNNLTTQINFNYTFKF